MHIRHLFRVMASTWRTLVSLYVEHLSEILLSLINALHKLIKMTLSRFVYWLYLRECCLTFGLLYDFLLLCQWLNVIPKLVGLPVFLWGSTSWPVGSCEGFQAETITICIEYVNRWVQKFPICFVLLFGTPIALIPQLYIFMHVTFTPSVIRIRGKGTNYNWLLYCFVQFQTFVWKLFGLAVFSQWVAHGSNVILLPYCGPSD